MNSMNNLQTLVTAIAADPGLIAATPQSQINDGLAAAESMNALLLRVIAALNLNADGLITAQELGMVSRAIRANAPDYATFLAGHGNDENGVATGFHTVQNDGGTLQFGGRAFIDTVADAIYHFGFPIRDGRYVNEDGNANETAADVAGWLNYFLNGTNVKFGSSTGETLHSGDFSEVFADARNETFFAYGGDDKVWAGDGNDSVLAGSGDDTVGGGTGADTLMGEAGNDKLWAEDGDDLLNGGGGNDTLGGDAGDDSLFGESGRDELWAGEGNDLADGGTGDDKIGGYTGNDTLNGGDGRDTLYADDGDDVVSGGTGADILHGGGGSDVMGGGMGADTLHGGDGGDALTGDAGRDVIYAGAGGDTVSGGAGVDLIYLWEDMQAADTLIFALGDSGPGKGGADRVEGFESGVDVIDLRGIAGLSYAETAFTGGGAASVFYDGSSLRIDANGDAQADMTINFAWVKTMLVDDFLFA